MVKQLHLFYHFTLLYSCSSVMSDATVNSEDMSCQPTRTCPTGGDNTDSSCHNVQAPTNFTENGIAKMCITGMGSLPDIKGGKIDTINLPLPAEGESVGCGRWFEERFFKKVPVHELIGLARNVRGGTHLCHFGTRKSGTYNVLISIIFTDGVEWVAKIPKITEDNDAENKYLMSEYATLTFLQDVEDIPVPKVHGFSFTRKNPLKRPYFFMDKINGVTFFKAVNNGLSKEGIYKTLRQLAQVRKVLCDYLFPEIGSLTIIDQETCDYGVDKQLNIDNFFETDKIPYDRHWGPFNSSLQYYINIHQLTWTQYRETFPDPEDMLEKWKMHMYLGTILSSYVKEETGEFILTHTDLSASNILVDEKGSITGIIDWEFSTTLPSQAAEHYPLLLEEEKFLVDFEDSFKDPLAELKEWREFYAKQFEGSQELGEYMENVDAAIAFEKVLRNNEEVTLDNLVEKFRFLESTSTLNQVGLQFPWKKPTTTRLESGESSSHREIAVQTEIPETPHKNSSIRLSSESPSLNDIIYRPSPFKTVHCFKSENNEGGFLEN